MEINKRHKAEKDEDAVLISGWYSDTQRYDEMSFRYLIAAPSTSFALLNKLNNQEVSELIDQNVVFGGNLTFLPKLNFTFHKLPYSDQDITDRTELPLENENLIYMQAKQRAFNIFENFDTPAENEAIYILKITDDSPQQFTLGIARMLDQHFRGDCDRSDLWLPTLSKRLSVDLVTNAAPVIINPPTLSSASSSSQIYTQNPEME